ncbi:hypothetical protein B0T09DRAFT_395773 [Sordaria sp. MPI-SDFR-AT-0083]|nr:hypothetical protein B0T09DRAFT_395773 [Sordaria sp. MPI-SDFR-AT-0083]
MAQTPQQRRANLKFQKDQEARRGKSEDQIKKRVEKAPKSPISMFWLGKTHCYHHLLSHKTYGPVELTVNSLFQLSSALSSSAVSSSRFCRVCSSTKHRSTTVVTERNTIVSKPPNSRQAVYDYDAQSRSED